MEEREEIEKNAPESAEAKEATPWKKTLSEYSGYLIVILFGAIGLLISILKGADLSLSETMIGLGVGACELHLYLKGKKTVNLIGLILWYLVAVLGLISLILA